MVIMIQSIEALYFARSSVLYHDVWFARDRRMRATKEDGLSRVICVWKGIKPAWVM